jgi:hypothetical protein
MLSVRKGYKLDFGWTSMEPLRVGDVPSGLGTPDLFLTISDDDSPLLRVDAYGPTSPFDKVIVWQGKVFFGFGYCVYVVDPKEKSARTIFLGEIMSYFGHFYPSEDYLLVASGMALLRISPEGDVVWKSRDIGLDGVVVDSIENGLIHGRGEWDPPGGWEPFVLRLDSGELITG